MNSTLAKRLPTDFASPDKKHCICKSSFLFVPPYITHSDMAENVHLGYKRDTIIMIAHKDSNKHSTNFTNTYKSYFTISAKELLHSSQSLINIL